MGLSVDYRRMAGIVALEKKAGRKVVLVGGVYDDIHPGHIDFLRRASDLGTVLIVNVSNDIWAQTYKEKPLMTEEERLEVIVSLEMVNYATIHPSKKSDPRLELAISSKPDVIVKKADNPWRDDERKKLLRVLGWFPELKTLPRSSRKVSSTELKARLEERFYQKYYRKYVLQPGYLHRPKKVI